MTSLLARPPARPGSVLEVHQVWGNTLLASRWFGRDENAVVVGNSSARTWTFLGIPMGRVPWHLGGMLVWLLPGWSQVDTTWGVDFVVDGEALPMQTDWRLVERTATGWCVRLPDGRTCAVPTSSRPVVVDVAGSTFVIARVALDLRARVHGSEPREPLYAALLTLALALWTGAGAAIYGEALGGLVAGPRGSSAAADPRGRWHRVERHATDVAMRGARRAALPTADPADGKARAGVERLGGRAAAPSERPEGRTAGLLADGVLSTERFGDPALDGALERGVAGIAAPAWGARAGRPGARSTAEVFAGGGAAEGLADLPRLGLRAGAGWELGSKGEGGLVAGGGDPIIIGALDRRPIDEIVRRHLNALRYCWQRETRGAVEGKVVVAFTIRADGRTEDVGVRETTLHHPGTESCLVERFERMVFPAPRAGKTVLVSYPLRFTVQ